VNFSGIFACVVLSGGAKFSADLSVSLVSADHCRGLRQGAWNARPLAERRCDRDHRASFFYLSLMFLQKQRHDIFALHRAGFKIGEGRKLTFGDHILMSSPRDQG
jgi:hypothetical protein